jgi:hypothetical protein
MMINKLYTKDIYSGKMNLTEHQLIQLSQLIHESFSTFFEEELKYQVETLKDDDKLDWSYTITPRDSGEIYDKVQELFTLERRVTVE